MEAKKKVEIKYIYFIGFILYVDGKIKGLIGPGQVEYKFDNFSLESVKVAIFPDYSPVEYYEVTNISDEVYQMYDFFKSKSYT